MDKTKLQTLKGFRDFLPDEAKKRLYLKNKFRETFELYGFEPLETPTLEYEELLLNKYGDEADKLVFRFEDEGGRRVAMRYDQTVPTSRILAMYRENLPMPWRRYQIQNAFRAEKPQKGRFREFTQCDIDIFGTTSPLSDAEVLSVGNSLLKKLGFKNFKILINDRAILFQLIKAAEIVKDMELSVIQSIDKLDKKSRPEIEEELRNKGVLLEKVHMLFDAFDSAKPTKVLKETMDYGEKLGIASNVLEFTPRLARGLDYYNSVIYEFVIEGYPAGSVAGGGRYDKLIEQLSGVDIPATGYSWGFDRLLQAMEQFGLFPETDKRKGVLVSIFNEELASISLRTANKLRENGVMTEVFPDTSKDLRKQLKFADKKGIKHLIVIGPDEAKKEKLVLKDLETGHQEELSLDKVLDKLTNK